jgi:hypothetical protein
MNDRIAQLRLTQAAPFLRQGEVGQHVFLVRRGEDPWVAAWSTIARLPRPVVATDQAILVLSTRWMGRRAQ